MTEKLGNRKNILAIETSTDACSAAILSGDKIIDRFKIAPQEHTKLIFKMIDEILCEANLKVGELHAIAFGAGPGSFTGVRLAASITQGLAFALEIPVIKISPLRALAQEVYVECGKSKVFVASDARMQEIYFGMYHLDAFGIMQEEKPDRLIVPENIIDVIYNNVDAVGAGNGFAIYDVLRCAKIQVIDKIYPQAKYVACLACADFAGGFFVNPCDALPVYLRENVVKVP